MQTKNVTSAVFLSSLMMMSSSLVYADRDHRDRDDRLERSAPEYKLDKRYEHNRSYPRDGHIVHVLPDRHRPVRFKDRDYFYWEGVWYLPSGPNFTVIRPPVGVVVPLLPAFFTTIWIGSIPYYYANDTYYRWREDFNGYEVTAAPAEVEPAHAVTYVADELFIYPKQGQNEQQLADDRYTCHRWGVDQSRYDPTQAPANMSVDELSRLRQNYQRAMKTCLEGKGYSVK